MVDLVEYNKACISSVLLKGSKAEVVKHFSAPGSVEILSWRPSHSTALITLSTHC